MPSSFTRFLPLLSLTGIVIIATASDAAHSSTKSVPRTEAVATGSFDVELTPLSAADAPVGAMAISKKFQGDLTGSSVGQMLAVVTSVEGSAGYVAMERVTGELAGRKGTFALQHNGSMDKGTPSLSVTVVPDSATGELIGLTGSMDIKIEGPNHFYTFRYALSSK